MSAIVTRGLTKSYPGHGPALAGLDLEISAGQVFGLLGPNGAGKSTTIHLLLGLLRPDSGEALIFGEPPSQSGVFKRVGYLPESVTLHDYYTGRKLLEFYAALLGLDTETTAHRCQEVLELMDLVEAQDKKVAAYSKGMLQRLGFAQAMLHDPDLLILDEPTSSLDPVARQEFLQVVLACKAMGKTVLVSSHILAEIERVCDRVVILKEGQLVHEGAIAGQERSLEEIFFEAVGMAPSGIPTE